MKFEPTITSASVTGDLGSDGFSEIVEEQNNTDNSECEDSVDKGHS